ncbi:hypothetical protein [Agromyces sp. ZXT2-3]
MSGSYGDPDRPMTDPKAPVTSMDTEVADAAEPHEAAQDDAIRDTDRDA